jgi:predicted RNase H-like HicB family nuclease
MEADIKYELVLYWSEEDDAYVVEVPELPGCMADGMTYEEAIKNSLNVIKEWIETAKEIGRDIPKPKRQADLCLERTRLQSENNSKRQYNVPSSITRIITFYVDMFSFSAFLSFLQGESCFFFLTL